MIELSNVTKNSIIAVALSGGKDSMCLLNLLLDNKKALNLTVKAINIDHSIRGEESERDSSFVKYYCEKLGVELKFFKVDAINYSKENGYTLEEGARILRYEIFSNLVKEGFCDKVATAHHLNDQFETVLFNVFRGAGIKGATGINSNSNYIIRPLINTSLENIKNYIESKGIPYVEDSTNNDIDFTRNYIRKEIVPKILDRFPKAPDSVKRFTSILKEEDEFLQSLADSYIERHSDKYYLPLNLNNVLLKRGVKTILVKLGLKKDYEQIHLEDVCKLKTLKTGSKIVLPKNIVAVKEYEKITIFVDKKIQIQKKEYIFSCNLFDFNDKCVIIKKEFDSSFLVFDGDKIPKNAVLRTRKEGDVFTKFKGGTKKLKDYFIDKKIPKLERDNIPLIAIGNEILLIFGVEISDKIKVDENTINNLYAGIMKNNK